MTMTTFTQKFFDAQTKQEITDPRELDAHDTYAQARCDEDGSRVHIASVGTSEVARCERGHRR
jgi:hypothetical protein